MSNTLSEEELKKVAALLHDQFCPHNHTDGCGWFYEGGYDDTWGATTHSRYLYLTRRFFKSNPGVALEEFLSTIDRYLEVKSKLDGFLKGFSF